MSDLTDEAVKALLDGATPGRRVQFHGSYCPEAVGTPFTDWDTSHDVSVIRPDGSRYRLAHYKHASDAYLSQMAPDLARALLDTRAELAQARADAKAAQALVVERFRHDLQFMVDSIAEDKAYVADKYPALFKTIQARRAEMGTLGGVQVFGEIARDLLVLADADGLAAVDALRAEIADLKMNMDADLRTMVREGQQLRTLAAELAAAQQREAELRGALEMSRQGWRNALELDLLPKQHRHSAKTMADIADAALAPADGLAMVQELRVEARENAMQALAAMGQAQEAYEAQLEAEAELARLRDRERVLADFIAEFAAAKIDALRHQPAYGESPEDAPDPVVEAEPVWAWQEDARAALAPTPTDPGDGWTWNERLGWIGPDGKPAARGGA